MKQTAQSRKVNEAARAALADILLMQVADPRLSLVTVTGVEVSKDRSVANVFISANRASYDEVKAGLASAKGRVRTLLGQELGWRVTPELRFFLDTSIDEAERISRVLSETPETLQIPKDEEGYPLAGDGEGYPLAGDGTGYPLDNDGKDGSSEMDEEGYPK